MKSQVGDWTKIKEIQISGEESVGKVYKEYQTDEKNGQNIGNLANF